MWHIGCMNEAIRVLLADDDRELVALLSDYLQMEGMQVTAAHDGEAALAAVAEASPDIVVLDIMMPKLNGIEVLRRLREGSNLPVIMLTARGDPVDRIVGLEIGADDYLPKPCNPRELVARIRAILRRTTAQPETVAGELHIGDIELRQASRTVVQAGHEVVVTSTEFEVLRVLLESAGSVVGKAELSEAALGRRLQPYDRSLDMHISHLRSKLGELPDGGERIKTVRNVGYLYVKGL
jgi:DNA-binding response OmpR family regulator